MALKEGGLWAKMTKMLSVYFYSRILFCIFEKCAEGKNSDQGTHLLQASVLLH